MTSHRDGCGVEAEDEAEGSVRKTRLHATIFLPFCVPMKYAKIIQYGVRVRVRVRVSGLNSQYSLL